MIPAIPDDAPLGTRPTIGMVVPALAGGGGVPAVADFLCTQIERAGRYTLRIFSLATSSRDDCSLRLRAPHSWLGAPRSRTGLWNGRPYTHFGATAAEFEFQRYGTRSPLTRALRECDLIQVVAGSPAAALCASKCDRPVVLQVATLIATERASAVSQSTATMRWWREAMMRVTSELDDRALATVDAIMVQNEWMLKYARERSAGLGRVVKSPPGVDCEAYTPLADRKPQVQQHPYILFVGRFADPRKNLTLLCAAYSDLVSRMPDPPRLILAGHEDLPVPAAALLARCPDQARIRIVRSPSARELRSLYQHAACLALPSHEEGFGMVVIEAMASGIPVVATRCGGPEEIIDEGETGYLVPLDDAKQLASRLELLCTEASQNVAMGLRARAQVELRYSATAAFQPFAQIYDYLLNR